MLQAQAKEADCRWKDKADARPSDGDDDDDDGGGDNGGGGGGDGDDDEDDDDDDDDDGEDVPHFYISKLPIVRLCGCYWYW